MGYRLTLRRRPKMASLTKITETKRRQTSNRQNHRRKRKASKKSTLSYEELFAEMGPLAKPQPK